MKIKMQFSKRDYRIIGITLATGLLLGWAFFHSPKSGIPAVQEIEEHDHSEETTWTCSMHPQIRMNEPGQCPICGMDLIPLTEYSADGLDIVPEAILMTEAAMKLADIQTITVQKSYPDKEIYMLGKVKPDERNIAELTARYGGRIEKLYVNFTGRDVQKGEKLATVYSPALITAQKELLEAQSYRQSSPEFYKAARNKLKLWDLTEEQINHIEQEGEAQLYFNVLSPISGTVTKRHVATGDYISEGSSLFQVIDLTHVWIMFEAYENDLPWIRPGDKVTFTVQSLPGNNYSGRIAFIDPVIDPRTRIAQVRVEVKNPGLLLKPEMFVNGIISSSFAGNSKSLIIPKTAVLWTGKRSVVYVKEPDQEQPVFKYKEIILGPSTGNSYVVLEGLHEGEDIAVNGVFRIDAAAQLAGKTSMMNSNSGAITLTHKNADTDFEIVETAYLPVTQEIRTKAFRTQESSKEQYAMETEIDPEFTKQITEVYNTYLLLKNAFVQSSSEAVVNAAEAVDRSLENADMTLLEGETHMNWMEQLGVLKTNLEQMIQNRDIETQREAFAAFSQVFYQCIHDYGLDGTTTYYQFCPMAFNNNGAFWLSEINEIRNPYFGDAMLTCGETKETLKYE